MNTNTPVVFIIYKRPETTHQVFTEIARAKPETLFVIADGARLDHPDEADLVKQARAVVETIDWECNVYRNYADTNLGLKFRIASGLDWVFQNVEEAIILEDDCLPHPTFFSYCEELLARYRDEPRVMHISGSNLLYGKYKTPDSYFFSRWPYVWGWATWRRAWTTYDVNLAQWLNGPRDEVLRKIDQNKVRKFWQEKWDRMATQDVRDVWSYQWIYSLAFHEALAITPACNLISNIGFGAGSTHTKDITSKLSKIPLEPMQFPLKHPQQMRVNARVDRQVVATGWRINKPPILVRVKTFVRRLASAIKRRLIAVVGTR